MIPRPMSSLRTWQRQPDRVSYLPAIGGQKVGCAKLTKAGGRTTLNWRASWRPSVHAAVSNRHGKASRTTHHHPC